MDAQPIRKVKGADLFWTVSFLVIGLVCVGLFGHRIVVGASSSRWPTTDGVITRSDILRGYDSDGGDTYEVRVAYEYRVDDVVYAGERVSAVRTIKTRSRETAEDALLTYDRGTEVTVSYHPRDPQQAVLETGVRWTAWLGLVLALIGTGGGTGYLARLVKRSRFEKSAEH